MAVDLVVVTATAGAIPASIPLLGRNSKNSHIAILLTGCVCSPYAVFVLVAISFFVAERSAGQFRFFKSYNERGPEGESHHHFDMDLSDIHRLHLSNMHAASCL